MFLLVNTFHRIPGDTAGHIVSKHRSEKKAFERKRLESRSGRWECGLWSSISKVAPAPRAVGPRRTLGLSSIGRGNERGRKGF